MLAGDAGGARQWQSVGEFGFGNTLGHGAFTLLSCADIFLYFLTSIMTSKWIVDEASVAFVCIPRPAPAIWASWLFSTKQSIPALPF
jgi:hypothetical protein